MKGYKKLVPILLCVLVVLSCYMLYDAKMSVLNEYNGYVKEARKLAKQGIIVDAFESYIKATEVNDNVDINIEIGEMYLNVGDVGAATNWGEEIVSKFPKESKAYEFLLGIHKTNLDYEEFFELYNQAKKREVINDKISGMYGELEYSYYLEYDIYEDVGVYSSNLCPVKKIDGKWGYLNTKGKRAIPYKYEKVGAFMEDVAPVTDADGNMMFIDTANNKKIDISSIKNVVAITSKVSGVFAAYNGQTWDFYNENCEKLFGGYDAVSTMGNQMAAVRKNGYWSIINTKGQLITESKYSDVLQDEKGVVYRNGVFFANIDGYYYLINAEGEKVSDTKYEQAHIFNDTTYAAVKTSKGWTFIDASGNQVIKEYFDNARSFSNGLAAVQKNGKWGYINKQGEVAIDYAFEGAQDFNSNGCTFVKKSGEGWQMLKLYSMNY